jgi:hypothetical protein
MPFNATIAEILSSRNIGTTTFNANAVSVQWTVDTITYGAAMCEAVKGLRICQKSSIDIRIAPTEVLMKTLDELWYGNISPFEQCTRGDKRLKELLPLMARNRDELGASLTDKQKETLEKFEDCMNEMHSITERDAFSYGFRLGVQLMAEAFLQPIGEDENL